MKENSTQFWNSNYYSIEQFHSRMEIDTNDADIGVANIRRERKMEGRNNIIISMESGRP